MYWKSPGAGASVEILRCAASAQNDTKSEEGASRLDAGRPNP
jgi:hypothetical protein